MTTTLTIEELRTFRKVLQMRAEDYKHAISECKKSILNNPTDRNLDYQFTLISEYTAQCKKLFALSLEARFDIEDITGEEEQ